MSEQPRPLDAQPILEALVEGGIEFVVIGGLAVGAHGHPRATKDIDIVPAPRRENLTRLAKVLRQLDSEIAGASDFDPEELVQLDLSGLEAGGSWVLLTKHGGLDVMQDIAPGFDYESLDAEAIEDEVFGLRVRFCGYRHLVEMKEAAGRAQDRADLEALRDARGEV